MHRSGTPQIRTDHEREDLAEFPRRLSMSGVPGVAGNSLGEPLKGVGLRSPWVSPEELSHGDREFGACHAKVFRSRDD
jgi:hypothetical protein